MLENVTGLKTALSVKVPLIIREHLLSQIQGLNKWMDVWHLLSADSNLLLLKTRRHGVGRTGVSQVALKQSNNAAHEYLRSGKGAVGWTVGGCSWHDAERRMAAVMEMEVAAEAAAIGDFP